MSSKPTKSRYLYLLEVADMLGVKGKDPHTRRQTVRRLFRRLEERDGCTYLHKVEASSKLKVCVDDLAQLDPYEPTTQQALKARVEELEREKLQLKARIARLERFAVEATTWMKSAHLGTKSAHEGTRAAH